jgi:hypothetical protein
MFGFGYAFTILDYSGVTLLSGLSGCYGMSAGTSGHGSGMPSIDATF